MTDWIAVNNLVQLMLIVCAPLVVFWVVRDIRRWLRWNRFRLLGIEWGRDPYLPRVGHVNPGATLHDRGEPIFVYPPTSRFLTDASHKAREQLEEAIRTRIRDGGLRDPENRSQPVIRPKPMGNGAHRFFCPGCCEEVWYRCLCGYEEIGHDPE